MNLFSVFLSNLQTTVLLFPVYHSVLVFELESCDFVVSNAFDKSRKLPIVYSPLSIAGVILSTISSIITSSVDLFSLKPYGSSIGKRGSGAGGAGGALELHP